MGLTTASIFSACFFAMQWAAVRTNFGEMSVPPQKGRLVLMASINSVVTVSKKKLEQFS